MKNILLKFGQSFLVQIITFSLLVGFFAYASVPFPDSNPSGTVIGGKFMGYFHQIFSKDCKSIKDFRTSLLLTSSSGNYTIYPDKLNGITVYCDMTTSGGGWTRYVKIKGDYDWKDAYGCLQGKNISNSKLECFSPVYANPKEILTRQGGEDYISDIPVNTVGAFKLVEQLGETDYAGVQRRYNWAGRGYFDGMSSSTDIPLTNTGMFVNPESQTSWHSRNYIRLGLTHTHNNIASREYGGISWDNKDSLSKVVYMNHSSYGRTGPRCRSYYVNGSGVIDFSYNPPYSNTNPCNRTNPLSQTNLYPSYLDGGIKPGEIYFR